MRVLVVGSARPPDANTTIGVAPVYSEQITEAAVSIGGELAKRGHTIVVGSDDPIDVDPHVVDGALQANGGTNIEVHLPEGFPSQYRGDTTPPNVKTVPHQFPDWDVTTMEVVRDYVDGVLAVGGRTGVIHAGLSAWMLGKPVICVGSFGGGAQQVGRYGSSRRAEFYHGGLKDVDIDRLNRPWGSEVDAKLVVDALERVKAASDRARISRRLLLTVSVATLLSLVLWVILLAAPDWLLGLAGNVPSNGMQPATRPEYLVLLFPTVAAAGLVGAMMQTLREIRQGVFVPSSRIWVNTLLGLAAGVVVAILYLLAQIGVGGRVQIELYAEDYARIGIIVSLAALFAAFYLDKALARFDKISDSVITGTYEG